MTPSVEGRWIIVDDHLEWNWCSTDTLQRPDLHRLFAEHLEQTKLPKVSLEPCPKG